MDNDTWSLGLSTSSRGHHLGSDHCFDYEEVEEEEVEVDLKAEFPCPFCSVDFDRLVLYCHIDEEHPLEAEAGVCPFCDLRVGRNMVAHITSQHGDIFELRHKLKLLRGETCSTPSLSRKDSLDRHLQSFLGGLSHVISSSNLELDPLLSSFINFNWHTAEECESVHPRSLTEPNLAEKRLDENMSEREIQPSSLLDGQASSFSDEDHGEKARRSAFVQGLLWSTILDDCL